MVDSANLSPQLAELPEAESLLVLRILQVHPTQLLQLVLAEACYGH